MRFHSDRRAPKFAQLAASPKCSVLFYDKASKLQLRASGVATLHLGDGDATRAWRESNEASRRCYHVEEPPSAPTTLDRLRTLEEGVLAAAVGDADPPSAHFAAIVVHVQRLEAVGGQLLQVVAPEAHKARARVPAGRVVDGDVDEAEVAVEGGGDDREDDVRADDVQHRKRGFSQRRVSIRR